MKICQVSLLTTNMYLDLKGDKMLLPRLSAY